MTDSSTTEILSHYRPIEQLVPQGWQEGSITVSDGQAIHYHRTGSGKPAVILLHGFQSAGLTWLRTAKALENDYDIIMPDFRGHGGSSTVVEGFSLGRLTEDIAELIQALNLKPAFLIGHSMGGEIAGRVAVEYPDRVRGVILVDPAMRPFRVPAASPDGEMMPWLKQWYDTLAALKTQSHADRLLTALTLMPPGTTLPGEEDYVTSVEAQAQFNVGVVNHGSYMDYQIATHEMASQIRYPLLLMTGNPQLGSGATPEGTAAIMDSGQGREAITFEKAGHFIPAQQFDTFIQAVKAFLQAH